MDIPQHIEFNFLSFLMGIGLMVFIFISPRLGFNLTPTWGIFTLVISALLVILSLGAMKEDYELDREMKELQLVNKKAEILLFLKQKKLLTPEIEENMREEIKKALGR